MSQIEQTQGLTCPNCSGVVPVPEGARIVICPFCQMRSLVQGERGVRRWQVARRVERKQAVAAVDDFFSGMKKARDLKRSAHIRDVFLVYLPYWRVQAFVAGWLFGRVKSGEDSTKPVEVEVMEEMHWNDAAVDVSEFGVHRVALSKQDLQPYDADRLHGEAMVFEPSESRTDALAEATQHFLFRGRRRRRLHRKYFEKFHLLRQKFSLVYYPLWVTRYEYRRRHYQVVVDGVHGNVLYGKAPGNILYRAAALVVGIALGNLILVNGSILVGTALANSDDSDGLAILLLPVAIGLGLIIAGYRAFRYGEEVEDISKESKKAALSAQSGFKVGNFSIPMAKNKDFQEMLQTGMNIIEELSEMDASRYRGKDR